MQISKSPIISGYDVVIVFWGPNEGDRKCTYIPRLFSEYMLTFRVEEPMKMCVTNQIRNIYLYIFDMIINCSVFMVTGHVDHAISVTH